MYFGKYTWIPSIATSLRIHGDFQNPRVILVILTFIFFHEIHVDSEQKKKNYYPRHVDLSKSMWILRNPRVFSENPR